MKTILIHLPGTSTTAFLCIFQFCRKVWLGRYDSQLAPEFNTKDELRMREMMSQRYDKKRWYVQPTDVMYEEARQQNTTASTARTSAAAAKPLTLLVGNNVPPLTVRHDVVCYDSRQRFSVICSTVFSKRL